MRALVCSRWCHYSELELIELQVPVPGPGQVRIDVHYATVGHGHILIVAGKYQRKPDRPFVPGTEVAGVIGAVGPGVQGLAPGDRVVAALDWGAYAEATLARADRTWKVPDAVALNAAVNVPIGYATSYAGLHWRARIQPDETLVVFGAAGGVGQTAVELGRLAGANVIAVAGSPERVEIARSHGAHHGLVHTDDHVAERLRALNRGLGVDVVFDPVGGPLFNEALRCVRPDGRILLVGFASGTIPQIPANVLLVKNIDVLGFNYGHYLWGWKDEPAASAERLRAMMDAIFAAGAQQQLTLEPGPCFALDHFVDAFDAVAERRTSGRVAMKIAR